MSIEEACRLCREDPKYSLGKKIQIYMIRSTTDVIHVKQHKREFIDSLTPEEKRIYRDEVQPMNMRQMVWREARKYRKGNQE